MSTVQSISHQDGQILTAWAIANLPKTDEQQFNPYWNKLGYLRDDLLSIFFTEPAEAHNHPVRVVGVSKVKTSVTPICSLKVEKLGLEVRLASHFHHWLISVRSDHAVPDVFGDLFNRSQVVSPHHLAKFGNWAFGPYSLNPDRFSVSFSDDYRPFTFLFLVKTGLTKLLCE